MTLPPSINPDFLDLGDLFRQGRAASYPVASVAGVERTWEDFVRSVSGWREVFATRPERRFALHHADTWTFATALFGGWAASKELLLPGDTQPNTLEAALAEVDAVAGDFPPELGKPHLREANPSSRITPLSSLHPEWRGLVVMTSGSTGRPTPFPKRLVQLSQELRAQELTFGARIGKARVLGTVSHQHIYGLLFRVLWPLCAGRVFESRQLYFPEEILAQGQSAASVALVTSPAHLKRLPETLPWHTLAPRLRAVFSSGGPLDFPSAELTQRALGQWPVEIYGSSETGGVAYRERSREQMPWQPLPGVELSLDADADTLRVRSPHLLDASWFTTPDRVALRNDGSFELLGRRDRIVKIEEKRISLEAVQSGLETSDFVQEARVVVLEGARTELGAVIVPSSDGAARLAEHGKLAMNQLLRDFAARSVERIGVPRRFRYVDALPINAQGKVSEEALRGLFREEASS